MAQLSDQTQDNAPVLMVVSRQPNGYRRAGLAFNKGDNHLPLAELSDEQVAAIKADPRFKVFETSMAVDSPGSLDIPNGDTSLNQGIDSSNGNELTSTIAGVKDNDGTERNLDDMKVDELRELAISLDVEGAKGMKKAELIAAIKSIEVKVPNDAVDQGAN
ncbi:HI1506-related protein [Shewanella sp.]|uniref:HI1506-related protein n=1 Tax=Shewanella sp. TaxID=50422 RepID=UPI003A86D872